MRNTKKRRQTCTRAKNGEKIFKGRTARSIRIRRGLKDEKESGKERGGKEKWKTLGNK